MHSMTSMPLLKHVDHSTPYTPIAKAYQRRPRGPEPRRCYWDAIDGVWRKCDSHTIYDPKERERKRNRASRHKETTRYARLGARKILLSDLCAAAELAVNVNQGV